MIRRLITGLASLITIGCATVPTGIKPVTGFDLDRYLGRWFEIARLDHRFERDLANVTAEYSKNADGTVKVVNRGYSTTENRWKEVVGKAKVARGADEGFLKVSFFGPFYGSYIIFELDEDGRYAFVAGPDRSFLWLLARSPEVPDAVRSQFVTRAKELGFDTDNLVFVDHRDR